MKIDLKNRNFLKLLDFNADEIHYLLDLATKLKKAKASGLEEQMLSCKNVALIFEKTSTRTRCAFEVAAFASSRVISSSTVHPTRSAISP